MESPIKQNRMNIPWPNVPNFSKRIVRYGHRIALIEPDVSVKSSRQQESETNNEQYNMKPPWSQELRCTRLRHYFTVASFDCPEDNQLSNSAQKQASCAASWNPLVVIPIRQTKRYSQTNNDLAVVGYCFSYRWITATFLSFASKNTLHVVCHNKVATERFSNEE